MASRKIDRDPRRFYVYLIYRPDGTPCYVGKGQGNRWKDHSKATSNAHLRNIYKNSLEDLLVVKVKEGLTEEEAHAEEVLLISTIGRKRDGGPLVNQTDGGEGTAGFKATEEQLAGWVERGKKIWEDPSYRERNLLLREKSKDKMIAGVKASWANPEVRERIIAAQRKGREDTEVRKRRSEISKAIWSDPETRKRTLDAQAKSKGSEAYRNKRSAISTAVWSDQDRRDRLSAKISGRVMSEETKVKISAGNRGKILSAETRAKISAAHKRRSTSIAIGL